MNKMMQNRPYKPRPIEEPLKSLLDTLPLGGVRYFDQIDSTNVEASIWASLGAVDLSLVAANEQTAGRGRGERKWFTPPDTALAFSLIVRQHEKSSKQGDHLEKIGFSSARWTALGALAVCQALQELHALNPQIKWPNDVLLGNRKTAGVLAEAHWQAGKLEAIILGIGINIAQVSVPSDAEVLFPATCVEAAVGYPISRYQLLHAVIQNIMTWRERINHPGFIRTWDSFLAFKGKQVTIFEGVTTDINSSIGTLIGLDENGSSDSPNPARCTDLYIYR